MTVGCMVTSIGWGLEALARVSEGTEDLAHGLERQRGGRGRPGVVGADAEITGTVVISSW